MYDTSFTKFERVVVAKFNVVTRGTDKGRIKNSTFISHLFLNSSVMKSSNQLNNYIFYI